MYCPHCGQQQASDVVRYCSRCGFLLDGVIYLLHNGGLLPVPSSSSVPVEMSPKRRGVRQGGLMLLIGAVLVPILGVFGSFTQGVFFEILVAVAAIICFVGGPIRMIYAALFEEGAPQPTRLPLNSYSAPALPPRQTPMRGVASLPPPAVNQTTPWRARPNTAELVSPPSVTENTTRLLDKDEQREH
jgi:hypothetical protein